MAENFFSGGTMPSDDLLLYFQNDFIIDNHWVVNGKHYQKTLEAWCRIMDSKKRIVFPLLAQCYGVGEEIKWYVFTTNFITI
jgi:cyclopropane-fatty-acyl-phospholipid synthase